MTMGADNSFELISIETYGPIFFGRNKIFLGSLNWFKLAIWAEEHAMHSPEQPGWYRMHQVLTVLIHTLYNAILRTARNFLETRENVKISTHPFYHINLG